MTSAIAAEIGARLDRIPLTRFHRNLLFLIGAGLLVDGVDTYLTAAVSGALVKQHVATLHQIAYLAMVTSVGLGVGGLAVGGAADWTGRRAAMRWSILIVCVGSLGAALAPSFNLLLAWRLLTCIGLGGETVLGYATLGEFMPPAWRGRWLARLGLLANLGMPVGLLIGYFVLPHAGGWRWMLAIPGVGAAAVFLLRRRLTESPRWLAARGRAAEALAVVLAIEATSSAVMPPLDLTRVSPETGKSKRLFSRALLSNLAVGVAVNITIMSAVFGFVTWLPTFFASSGSSITKSLLFAAVISLGGPLGTIAGMLITDRVERKWGVVGCSVAAALVGLAYGFARTPAAILGLGLADVTVLYAFGTLGLVSYVPELFPTPLRMRAVALCATAGRAVIMVLPLIILPIFTATGQLGVVSMISALLLAQAVVVAVLGAPTRGRSLESV